MSGESSWVRACAWAQKSSRKSSKRSSRKSLSKMSAQEAAEQRMTAARSHRIAKQRWAPSLQVVAEEDEPEAELAVVSEPEREPSDGEPESGVSEPERDLSDREPELECELEEGF